MNIDYSPATARLSCYAPTKAHDTIESSLSAETCIALGLGIKVLRSLLFGDLSQSLRLSSVIERFDSAITY